jgi:hypothetical protein
MFDDDEDGGKWIPSDNDIMEVVLTLAKGEKKNPTGCIFSILCKMQLS